MKLPSMPDWLLYGLMPFAVITLVFALPSWPTPVRQVVLSPQDCAAAALLHVPATEAPGGQACSVTQSGMRKDASEVQLSNGTQLSMSVVVAWLK